ncbi:hypothetical protein PVT68_08030 [Microbulbifer bruguierae]|uniref:Asparagine synthetase domain-containing protein n=1 Tax=Microbulbifer bruguierae TaxID=3029061 RepID=A0ABY8NH32_9GAMM|nr:hypothetical protein [Microbulbifer bruguierae]WGL18231.1 hypothetical protein PVT68_08030 [Microbulbifer bruguierae]
MAVSFTRPPYFRFRIEFRCELEIFEPEASSKKTFLNLTRNAMQFPKQFLLTKTPTPEFPGWKTVKYLDWWLAHAPELSLIQVLDERGSTTGLIAGWVIWRGKVLGNGDTIRSKQQSNGIASEYDELCGRFVYFFEYLNQLAVISDAGGLMSPVYSEERNIVASSPAVIRQKGDLKKDERICQAFVGYKSAVWYPFGTTPFQGLRRLLPNHRLTLSNWRADRFFPVPAGEGLRGDPQVNLTAASASIAKWTRANLKALVDAGHNVAHLTGGFDSRMVLAASHDFHRRMRFQTVATSDPGNRLDCHIAERLAKRYGLNYRKIDFITPSKAEIDGWLERTGHCIEDTVSSFCTTARVHNSHCHEITGACGEVMRAAFWFSGDGQRKTLSADALLRRYEIAINETTLELAEQWMATLPAGVSVGNLLDIAYLELRLAGWAGASLYGHDIEHPSLSPFNSARIYRAVLSIPENLREENQIAREFIQSMWPELLHHPVNRPQGLDKLRFLSQEFREMLPTHVRKQIKRLINPWRNPNTSELDRFRS